MTTGPSRLYIVGNGFDLHHGIKSRYVEFGHYLELADPQTYDQVERYLAFDADFWAMFEARLADLDVDSLIDYASNLLQSYGADDWRDSGHHDYQYEILEAVRALSSTLREQFANWIRHLAIPDASSAPVPLLRLDRSALYLNFNYTETLQKTYGIPNARILHIHGQAASPTSDLVLGHGWKPQPEDSLNHGLNFEEADSRIVEGNQIIDRYFAQTFKPTDDVIARNRAFFSALGSVKEIVVLGHSFSEVDGPYIDEIIANVAFDAVDWRVACRSTSAELAARVAAFNITRVTYLPWSAF